MASHINQYHEIFQDHVAEHGFHAGTLVPANWSVVGKLRVAVPGRIMAFFSRNGQGDAHHGDHTLAGEGLKLVYKYVGPEPSQDSLHVDATGRALSADRLWLAAPLPPSMSLPSPARSWRCQGWYFDRLTFDASLSEVKGQKREPFAHPVPAPPSAEVLARRAERRLAAQAAREQRQAAAQAERQRARQQREQERAVERQQRQASARAEREDREREQAAQRQRRRQQQARERQEAQRQRLIARARALLQPWMAPAPEDQAAAAAPILELELDGTPPGICAICMNDDKPREMAFTGCGHVVACAGCTRRMQDQFGGQYGTLARCPTCRQVSQPLRLIFS